MIKYLGSKRTLLPLIVEVVAAVARGLHRGESAHASVLDLFSGTARVGHALKRAGHQVIANDHNAYAHALAACYVQADAGDVLEDARRIVREFNEMRDIRAVSGYFTETFCVQSRFFQPKNGQRIDAIRDAIARKGLEPELEAVMLVSLMEAADRVDSTTGVQMAYLKQWAARAHNDLELRVPDVLPRAAAGKGLALCMDAAAAARAHETDIAYIDPPYNQHAYLNNYHVWESLIRWDKPPVYGIACKRSDCRERRSAFNSKKRIHDAFREILSEIRARALIVSFSDEGYISRPEMEALLAPRGMVQVIERDYKRYVGAQIGIFNPKGQKVGKVSHLRNTEHLFVVTPAGCPELDPLTAATPLPAAGIP